MGLKHGGVQDRLRRKSAVNNAKTRRSTRSVLLGKAKVMSYNDLEKARAKRKAKEQAATTKGKRGRKRKAPATDQVEVARSLRKSEAVLLSESASANAEEMSWRAPVAKMY
jgi:hypothetical protein